MLGGDGGVITFCAGRRSRVYVCGCMCVSAGKTIRIYFASLHLNLAESRGFHGMETIHPVVSLETKLGVVIGM